MMVLAQGQSTYTAMGQEKRSRKAKRRLTPRKLTGLVCIGLLAYMIFSFSRGFYQAYQLKQEIKVLEAQLAEVQEQNRQLQEELEYSQTPEAIEKIAREKLGLIKPGEIVIMRARQAQ